MSQAAQSVRTAAAAAPRPAVHERPPYLPALAAAVAVFALYAFTLAPTTAFWDTSEYIATAHILGIPHPPGNPLFVLLARAWELLLSPLGLPTAVRINTFSAFMSAGTAFFWYLAIHRILGFSTGSEVVRRVGAGVSVLVSATAFTVWNQSNVNEKVYTVSMFTIAALTWLAFLWRDHVEEHRGVRGGRFHDDNVLVLGIFILALSVGNHLMAFLAAPALLVFILLVRPRSLANWRLYAFGALFALGALTVNLYLPIRSGLHPIINEAAPSCPDIGSAILSVLGFGNIELPGACQDLHASLAREQYGKPPIFERQSPFWAQLLVYFQYFDWQWARSIGGRFGYFHPLRSLLFTLPFVLLGAFGAWEHWRRDRKSFVYMAVLFGTLSLGLVYYMNFKYGYTQVRVMGLDAEAAEVRERDYFFLVSFSIWGLYVGLGLTALWLRLSAAGEWSRRALLRGAPVLAVALVPLLANWGYASRRGDYAARDLAFNMLQSVEPYGVLFTNGDNDTFPLWYLQEVEGIRRDVTVIVLSYLNTPWYARQLRDLTSPCPQPGAADRDPTRILCQRPYVRSANAPFYDGKRAPTRSILPLTDAEVDAVTAPPGYVMFPNDILFQARGIEVPIPANKPLMTADQLVLAIVNAAWGDRPIYFAATTNAQYELNFTEHIERQGLAFRLVNPEDARGLLRMPGGNNYSPITGQYMDPARNLALLNQVFRFRRMPDRAHWVDDATRNIPMQYYYFILGVAEVERMRGNEALSQQLTRRAEGFRDLAENR
ncbi:MAG TPA: DUF2723 domain-containing protein [Longimicrobiaceae bacterium]|nr:DUF2723 domain-containing protein [Longimicrobiaceae bacterium]